MIRNLKLDNFKCFKKESFIFGQLTILCGENCAGKSSLIQSLLLLKEITNQISAPYIVRLNGPFMLELGQFVDILNNQSEGNQITFEVSDETKESKITFNAKEAEQQFLIAEGDISQLPEVFTKNNHFVYLCAERQGPRDAQHETQSSPENNLQVGVQGEFSAEALTKKGYEKIRAALLHPSTVGKEEEINNKLNRQLELWMQDFFPGLEIRSESLGTSNSTAIRIKRGGTEAEWLRPINVGFGVSYSLPIILAGLISQKNSILIIENPESHLHPEAQSLMGRFLATIAASGVQVIIETHSDHILNGIRLAVVDKHPIKQEDVIIYHFNNPNNEFKKTTIEISSTGALTSWPNGFFDQIEKDLAKILDARK